MSSSEEEEEQQQEDLERDFEQLGFEEEEEEEDYFERWGLGFEEDDSFWTSAIAANADANTSSEPSPATPPVCGESVSGCSVCSFFFITSGERILWWAQNSKFV